MRLINRTHLPASVGDCVSMLAKILPECVSYKNVPLKIGNGSKTRNTRLIHFDPSVVVVELEKHIKHLKHSNRYAYHADKWSLLREELLEAIEKIKVYGDKIPNSSDMLTASNRGWERKYKAPDLEAKRQKQRAVVERFNSYMFNNVVI